MCSECIIHVHACLLLPSFSSLIKACTYLPLFTNEQIEIENKITSGNMPVDMTLKTDQSECSNNTNVRTVGTATLHIYIYIYIYIYILCCFVLLFVFPLLASFFLPSHLSLKHVVHTCFNERCKKEGSDKQARSNKQQGKATQHTQGKQQGKATQHTQGSHFS